MERIIELAGDTSQDTLNSVTIGDRTCGFMQSQTKLGDSEKDLIRDEAVKILGRCIPPGMRGNVTNIAVGYVQSGKTLSFTTLTALAADSGYRIIIYLTGTKNNLQSQTKERLEHDLGVCENNDYELVDLMDGSEITSTIRNTLKYTQAVLLIPILKHHLHINTLSKALQTPEVEPILEQYGALIIDDEADQSSFNTYAKKNAEKEEWGEEDFSKTYTSILNLKKSLPSHSYIQYTATPQAAFLIDSKDSLSPQYHTVLTPGGGYTGGKYFFKDRGMDLLTIIPGDEVYHHRNNQLKEMPETLIRALREFFLSVVIVALIQKREPFLSMMIHVDGRRDTNSRFCKWVSSTRQNWIDALVNADNDPGTQVIRNSFKQAYDSITKYMESAPSFDKVIEKLHIAMIRTKLHLVQSGGTTVDQRISWKSAPGHILVGADMLNRGFTIERLSMSYMPRTTRGKSNADTIEQRCRFFGYKMNYIDVCRVFLSQKSLDEYQAYVDHEEALRTSLRECESLSKLSADSRTRLLLLTEKLNPTRTNILSSRLIRNKLSGWRQMISMDYIEENKQHILRFCKVYAGQFENEVDYGGNIMRNHRSVLIPIDEFVRFFRDIAYADVPNIVRRNVTIQYLLYLYDNQKIFHVRLYEMAYSATSIEDLRSHKVDATNIQSGYASNDSYPGDKSFKVEETICFQLHHFRIKQPLDPLDGKDVYNFCVYYPESLTASFVGVEEDEDDEDDIEQA